MISEISRSAARLHRGKGRLKTIIEFLSGVNLVDLYEFMKNSIEGEGLHIRNEKDIEVPENVKNFYFELVEMNSESDLFLSE